MANNFRFTPPALAVLLIKGLLTAVLFLPIAAFAAETTWDGGGGDDSWSNPLNWSGDALPGPTSRVVIGGGVTVHADIDATINGLSVENIGTTLVVDAGATLTLSNPGSGIRFFVGSLINNGIIDQLDGQLAVSDLTNNASGVINASDTLSFSGVNHGQINASRSVYLGGSVDNHGVFNANFYIRYWGNAPDAFTNHAGALLSVIGWLQLGFEPDPSSRDAMFVNNGSVFADSSGFTPAIAISVNTTIVNSGSINAVDPIDLSCGSDLIDTGTVTGTILTTCHSWTGLGASDNWSEAANWAYLAPPVSGGSNDIYLHSSDPILADVNTNLGSGDTLLTTGTSLTVNPGITVGVSGRFDNDGTVNVLGTLDVNPSGFVANDGLLDNGGVVDNAGDVSNGCTSGTIIQQPGSSWLGNSAWEACPDWDGGGSDSLWSNPLNWTSDVLPDFRSRVTIGGGASVHVDVDTAVAGLVLQGIGTALTVDAGTTLTLDGYSSGIAHLIGSLTNHGTIEQVRGQLSAGNLHNAASGVINSADTLSFGGVNDGQINASRSVYMGGSIDNHGQINATFYIRYWGRAPDVFTNHPGATMSVVGWLVLGNSSNPAIYDGSFVNQGLIDVTPSGFTPPIAITISMFVLNEGTIVASPIQNDAVLQNECGAVITGTVNGNPVDQLPCNEPPVAEDDAYGAVEDTPLNVAAPGVLANDTDPDNDPLTAVEDSTTSNGSLTLNGNGSFSYTPDPNYCGPDSFTYHANDGTVDSNVATVGIAVSCVNDAPVAVNNNYTHDEDTQLSGNVITDDTGDGVDSDVDVSDSLSMFSNTDVSHGTLVVNADASGAFTYDPNDNYCGPDSFTYVITDNPSTTPDSLTSNTATVAITVTCVNDPPTITSVTPGTQTAAYSDYIGTVTVEVDDVDDTSTTLDATNQPTLSEAGGMGLSSASCVPYNPDSESPAENGSTCTWTYTGQVLDPGDNDWVILFTPSDADGAGTVTGTHTLSIEPEDATIGFDGTNPVGVDVTGPGDNTSVDFTLSVAVMETTPDLPACIGCDPEPFGDINLAYVTMQLKPLVGGGSFDGDCSPTGVAGAGYGQTLFVDCNFGPTGGQSIPVNTYIVEVTVDGVVGDVDRYYTGTAEDVLVVFDPSLGYTTAGGWFYWPDTCDMDGEECDPDPAAYRGDKTNFGWTMKYNKKGNKVKGSMLMIRHTWNGEIYRVKSNALYGMAMGSEGGDYPYGFVSFSGKSNYREPGWVDGIGNHVFMLYAEDAGEQGCNQDSADKLWIEVQPTDDLTYLDGVPLNLGPDAADGLEAINCGNIFVPHKSGGKGGGKP